MYVTLETTDGRDVLNFNFSVKIFLTISIFYEIYHRNIIDSIHIFLKIFCFYFFLFFTRNV